MKAFDIYIELLTVILKGIILLINKEKDKDIIEVYTKYANATIKAVKGR